MGQEVPGLSVGGLAEPLLLQKGIGDLEGSLVLVNRAATPSRQWLHHRCSQAYSAMLASILSRLPTADWGSSACSILV